MKKTDQQTEVKEMQVHEFLKLPPPPFFSLSCIQDGVPAGNRRVENPFGALKPGAFPHDVHRPGLLLR